MKEVESLKALSRALFFSQGRVGLWRRAFWVPVGVRRSKCEQHLYRCCVIFIALLHLLGGISFSVNNQVNCTQTRSGTPANFFIVTLTQAIFLPPPPPPPPPITKKPYPFLHPATPTSPASPPKTLPASVKEGFMVPRRESGRAACSNGFTSREVTVLGCTALLPHGRAKSNRPEGDGHSRLVSSADHSRHSE